MRVLIVEPDLTGHHAPYLRHLLQAFSELGQQAVVLTSRGASQSPQFAIHLQQLVGHQWDERLTSSRQTLRNMQRVVAELRAALAEYEPDQVYAPYADILNLYLGVQATLGMRQPWPAGVEAEALLFRGTFAYAARSWRKRWRGRLAQHLIHRANWRRLHFLDPIPFDRACELYPRHAHRFRLMPDPVEPVQCMPCLTAREQLGIATDGTYFAYLGVMYDEARLARLLGAFERANLPDSCRMLLAGPMTEAVVRCVDQHFGALVRRGKVVSINRHLSVDEAMLGVVASNVVCVPAKHRIGSSSFIIRAAAANRPVLADNYGWTGWVIRHFNLGWSVDVDDVPVFSEGFRAAYEGSGDWRPGAATGAFVRYHSVDNFKAHWTSRLRERLELPQDPQLFSWQEVLTAA